MATKTATIAKKAATEVKDAAEKTGKYVSNNPKTALYIVLGVIGVVVVYKVVKGIGNFDLTETHKADLDEDINYSQSKLNDAQALGIAEQLYAIMSTVGKSNTKEKEAILAALKGLNVNDFIKVVDAFGSRQYSLTWGNVGDPWTSDKHHLLTWLGNELDAEYQQKLQSRIPGLQI
ncbi:MAG: hypothetical protein ACM31G_09715 [Flavobacteriales bacterium]